MEARPSPYERVIFVCCNEREPGEDACANRGYIHYDNYLGRGCYCNES